MRSWCIVCHDIRYKTPVMLEPYDALFFGWNIWCCLIICKTLPLVFMTYQNPSTLLWSPPVDQIPYFASSMASISRFAVKDCKLHPRDALYGTSSAFYTRRLQNHLGMLDLSFIMIAHFLGTFFLKLMCLLLHGRSAPYFVFIRVLWYFE